MAGSCASIISMTAHTGTWYSLQDFSSCIIHSCPSYNTLNVCTSQPLKQGLRQDSEAVTNSICLESFLKLARSIIKICLDPIYYTTSGTSSHQTSHPASHATSQSASLPMSHPTSSFHPDPISWQTCHPAWLKYTFMFWYFYWVPAINSHYKCTNC